MTELNEKLYVFTQIITYWPQCVYVRFYLKTSAGYKRIFNNSYIGYKDTIYVEKDREESKELIFSHFDTNDDITIPLNEIKSITIENEFGDYCFKIILNNEDCFIVGTWQ